MNHRLIIIFVATTLIVASCDGQPGNRADQVTLQRKLLLHSNYTNYEFEASVPEVKSAIKSGCAEWRSELSLKYSNMVWKGDGDALAKRLLSQALQLSGEEHLLWKGDADLLAKNLLIKPGNENDAYLYGDISPIGESQVYFKNGQPLIYYADFHIHVTAVSPKKTRVDISTYDSSVAVGVDENWSPRGPSLIEVDVDPTTIEEYQLLLNIGKQLGAAEMPPLVLPRADARTTEIKVQRIK